MVRRNVKLLVFAVILLVFAGTMLIMTIRGSNGGTDLTPGRQILDPDEVPDIVAPGGRAPEPIREIDNRPS